MSFLSLFAAALVAVSYLQSANGAVSCSRSYTVKEGDICDSISSSQGVSTYQLMTVNNPFINSECSNLIPGETICLGTSGEDCTQVHVVQPGDTCDGITGAAGINSTMLWGNNPQINSDCTNIYIGEVLCTAGSVMVPVANAGSPTPDTPPPSSAPATSSSDEDDGDEDDDDLPWCD